MYAKDRTPMQSSLGSELLVPPSESLAVSASLRRVRRNRRPGAALLAKLVDDPSTAPEWLHACVAALEAAGRPKRSLKARAGDLLQALTALDRLYMAHLLEVQQWFECAGGYTLDAALPRWTEALYAESGTLMRQQLLPELAAAGMEILPVIQMDERQRAWIHRYFTQSVYPLLTPLAVDPGRPFPYISSGSLNLLVELRQPDTRLRRERPTFFARVKIPASTPRLVAIPNEGAPAAGTATRYVCSADLVRYFVHHLFTGIPVHHVYLFRVLRGENPLPGASRRAGRHHRQENRPVVRLDVERRMPDPVLHWLTEHLPVPVHGVTRHDNLLESTCLPSIVALLQGSGAR